MLKPYILLIFTSLILSSFFLFGNDLNYQKDSLRAVETYSAGANLSRNGFYAESLDSLEVSIKLREKIYGKEDYRLGIVYSVIGIVYKNMGLYDLAIQNSLKAEELYIKQYGNNYRRIAGVYQNIGNIYKNKLNFNEALRYYVQMANIYSSQEEVNLQDVAAANYSVADMYQRMSEYNKAVQIIKDNLKNADAYFKIYYLDLQGAVYLKTGDYITSYKSYKEAIKQAEKLFSQNDINIGIEYLNYAASLIQGNKTDEVLEVLDKANQIIIQTQKEKGEYLAEYYRTLGTLYENKKAESSDHEVIKKQLYEYLSESINFYKKALITLNFPEHYQVNMDLDSMQLISKTRCFDLLKVIADKYLQIATIFEGQDKNIYETSINQALNYYSITSDLLQRAKKEITDDDSKIILAELEQSTSVKMFQTAFRAYDMNKENKNLELAFKNAEQLKSGSLFDKLSNDEAMKNSLIPDSLLQKEQKINSSISTYTQIRYNESLAEQPDNEKIAKTDSIIFTLKKQRTELSDFLEKNYNQYYNLKYSDNFLNIKDIQNHLHLNQVLIEYILNDNDSVPELYTFIIEENKADLLKQKIDTTFLNEIDSVFHFMASPRYIFTKNEDAVSFCLSANNLYKVLIQPYKDKIKDKEIVIIPDGRLNYISFDALLTELPDTSQVINFNKLAYLIRNNAINYSYSSNLLFSFQHKKRTGQKRVLAFSPEYKNDTLTIGSESFPLRPLPGTKKEVDLIASKIHTKKFEGSEANESNFRKYSLDFDILHLAMHAFINDSLPALSQFAFSQEKDKPIESDGLLSTSDIYNLNLNARLAVLSACNTGSGQLKKGEGVISLARGFLFAGCPSIVMTLWEVEDNSGTQIMSSFYKNLKKGKTKDEALRMAKLEYLKNANPRLAHPHYWLGFVSIGDNSPLFRSYDFYFFGLLFLTLIGVTIEQVIRLKKARKKRA